ncbi:hypothetical protein [Variovorax rhizosphaerae]|uniref:Uncharacterized protein n=1 Tax=Variovorax rhizosphaerae TaxID=1836200 RepID=A0ABU8WQ02_9BURK
MPAESTFTCTVAVATFPDGAAVSSPHRKPQNRTRPVIAWATRAPQYDEETRTQKPQVRFHSEKLRAEALELSWGPYGRTHDTKEIDLDIDIPEQAALVAAAMQKLRQSCERRQRALDNWDGEGDGPTFVPVVLRSGDSFIRHFCNGGKVECVPAKEIDIEMTQAEFDELSQSYGRFVPKPKSPSWLARLFGTKRPAVPLIGNLKLNFD